MKKVIYSKSRVPFLIVINDSVVSVVICPYCRRSVYQLAICRVHHGDSVSGVSRDICSGVNVIGQMSLLGVADAIVFVSCICGARVCGVDARVIPRKVLNVVYVSVLMDNLCARNDYYCLKMLSRSGSANNFGREAGNVVRVFSYDSLVGTISCVGMIFFSHLHRGVII